jgi:hypothetical protein
MSSSPGLALPAALPPRPGFRRIVVIDIVLPLLAVVLLVHNGVATLTAYATASVFPAIWVIVSWWKHRHVDFIGIGVLAGLTTALLTATLTGDPRFGLMRAAPAFAMFGLTCLVSLTTKRPLMFFVARAFATGGDAERVAVWNERLTDPRFYQAMRFLTAVWGVGTLAHAALSLAAAFLLPGSVALIVEPTLAIAVLAALLAWTRAFQRRGAGPAL